MAKRRLLWMVCLLVIASLPIVVGQESGLASSLSAAQPPFASTPTPSAPGGSWGSVPTYLDGRPNSERPTIWPPAWPAPAVDQQRTQIEQYDRALPPQLHQVQMLSQPQAADFPISTLSQTSEEAPAIDGAKVVWFDDRTQGPTDVWGYDLASDQQFQVTSHPAAQLIADISGDIVAYEDNRNGTWDIYAKRLSTGEEFVVATGPNHQRYPRVWGDYIVYQDETGDYWQSDVYLYRISTGSTTALAVAVDFQGDPDVDGGWVVWRDNRTGPWQVRAYRISDQTYHILEPGNCWGELRRPRIGGGMVVWQNACGSWPNPGYDIFGYDLNTGVLVTIFSGPGQQEQPVVSDVLIAWQDQDTYGNWDVFVYVRADGTIFPVTLEPSRQEKPAVFGNTVVWQDNRNHTWDIYGLIWDGVPPPNTTPALPNPRNLHVGAYPYREIHLSWTDNSANEQGFVIQRAQGIFSTNWQDLVTLPANTTSYVDSNLLLAESYWYRVRAFNADGPSSYTNESYSTAFDTVPSLDERYMHVLINEARMDPATWGYPSYAAVDPLGWDANLAYSARAHALGMNNSNCCQGHIDLAGRGPSDRAYDSGYPYGVGENLFVAQTGPEGMESAHQGFMDSEGHRNNIMAADLKQTAIGFAPGGRGTLVEVFSGGPSGTVPPPLPSGMVVPYTGTVSTTFDYVVSFWNEPKQPPSRAVVVIDGSPYAMTLDSGQAGRGTYRYHSTLALGDHNYHFEFQWGSPVQSARLPQTGEFSGPHVRPFMPDLRVTSVWSDKMVAGWSGKIFAGVENIGELSAANVIVRFYINHPKSGGTAIGASEPIAQLDPGQNQIVTISWQPTDAGPYAIYAWADPDNTIQEASESNNVLGTNVSVREANLTWYVDGSVAVSGNGQTPAQAFKTIRTALDGFAYPGDVVRVAAGVYYERFALPNDVRLVGDGFERTTIDGGGEPGSVITMNSGSSITGFTITGSGTDYFDSGIWHNVGDVWIGHCRFTGNSVGLFTWCWDVSCAAVAHFDNNIFDHNSRVALDANNEGVHLIVNNTVASNGRGIVMNNANSLAENNIIVSNSGDGLVGNGWGPTVRYNDVWNNGVNYVGASPGTGAISADPKFVDAAADNYHLQASSPAKNAGNPAANHNDPDGSRNDMGAYGGPQGFWIPPVGPMALEINLTPTGSPALSWLHVKDTVGWYEVYRYDAPYIDPAAPGVLRLRDIVAPFAAETISFTDEEVSTSVPTSYFYQVRPIDWWGDAYPASSQVGVFGFALAPGDVSQTSQPQDSSPVGAVSPP